LRRAYIDNDAQGLAKDIAHEASESVTASKSSVQEFVKSASSRSKSSAMGQTVRNAAEWVKRSASIDDDQPNAQAPSKPALSAWIENAASKGVESLREESRRALQDE